MKIIICKLFGHQWDKWSKTIIFGWYRPCERCNRIQEAGTGIRPNYKGLRIV